MVFPDERLVQLVVASSASHSRSYDLVLRVLHASPLRLARAPSRTDLIVAGRRARVARRIDMRFPRSDAPTLASTVASGYHAP